MQAEEIKAQYQRVRRHQIGVAVSLFLVLVVLLPMIKGVVPNVTGLRQGELALIFSIIAFGGAIYSWKKWRCPACEGYLGKGINPECCPKCGVKLS